MINDFTLAGLVGVAGQALTVAMLLTAGIAASWSFGREFVDEALPALYALATPRSAVVRAKFWVLLGWSVATVVATVVLTVVAGVALGLSLDGAALTSALHAMAAGVLSAALALPFAFVSSWRRGYLAGFVALVAVVVVTQLLTAVGVGGWFPYAAPALWMGMGGAQAAAEVSVVQLLLPVLVGAAAIGVTLDWWRHAEAR
jgi:ABC-2 type transport system permease protein